MCPYFLMLLLLLRVLIFRFIFCYLICLLTDYTRFSPVFHFIYKSVTWFALRSNANMTLRSYMKCNTGLKDVNPYWKGRSNIYQIPNNHLRWFLVKRALFYKFLGDPWDLQNVKTRLCWTVSTERDNSYLWILTNH